jgi:hypothetical protein
MTFVSRTRSGCPGLYSATIASPLYEPLQQPPLSAALDHRAPHFSVKRCSRVATCHEKLAEHYLALLFFTAISNGLSFAFDDKAEPAFSRDEPAERNAFVVSNVCHHNSVEKEAHQSTVILPRKELRSQMLRLRSLPFSIMHTQSLNRSAGSICSITCAPVVTFCLLFCALPGRAADYSQAWTDTGATFALGTLGNSGQNLYVNRRGELEVIRRYDLDGNGSLDLLFNSTHNMYYALPATLVTAAPGPSISASNLALDGSSRVVPYDLNRDGLTDLVFMPNEQNVKGAPSSVIIAWGAREGWSTARLTRQLPVNGATSIAVGDLNADGWPDILTLNSIGWLHGQPAGRIARVFWGSPDGYFLGNYQDLGIPRALEVVAGSFGAQRQFSAAVLTETGAVHYLAPAAKGAGLCFAYTVQLPATTANGIPLKPQCLLVQSDNGPAGDILWIGTNSNTLFRVSTTGQRDTITSVEAQPATHLAIGYLDDDPYPDLILTNLKLVDPLDKAPPDHDASTTILWSGADGVSAGRSTPLFIPNAASTAVGDLNCDGHGDLVVSVFQSGQSTKASSLVFFGDGSRRLPATGLPVVTEGARDVAFAKLTARSAPVAIIANSLHRTLDDAVPLRLYWGSTNGFSTKAMVDIPNLSGYKSSAADLNSDGFVDMIVVNGADVSEEVASRAPFSGVNIYWGGHEGAISGPGPTRFDPARRQILHEKHVGSINVADLNGSGYLDLVLGKFTSSDNAEFAANTELVIYYGSAAGFLSENRRVVRTHGRSIGCLIADFNRDGRLDIAVNSYTTNEVTTYWGGVDGFSNENKTTLPYPSPIDIEAADLNNDGWLDLLVSSYEDFVDHHHNTGLTIFWGGPDGWHQSNSQWLPGMAPLGLAVADLDGDGFLDIVAPSYYGDLTREHLSSYIYWGSTRGYAPSRRTTLAVNSASDVVCADFNGDGKLDLAFSAHSTDAGHLLDSPIFFNDGNRFKSPKVQYLPAVGPHYMWVQDIGNIYNRRYEEDFTSRIFAWTAPCRDGRLAVDAATPFGAQVRLQVRSAANETALASAAWRDVPSGAFEVSTSDRALQCRLYLISANGDAYPLVRKIVVRMW